MLNDAQSIRRMIEAGADGYCVKSAGSEELFAAIQAVREGQSYLPSDYEPLPASVLVPVLSSREIEILRLIVAGNSTKQIADHLFLSARTVETHRKNIYRKLGVHTNVELIQYARANRLI
ncbi:response regulator transcription factor [Spirosoma sp.]|uniref:response regulator transcription factor n=1 Tax=Spirosoma sp. TaxID=1899569 RepID=UPI003B3B94B8